MIKKNQYVCKAISECKTFLFSLKNNLNEHPIHPICKNSRKNTFTYFFQKATDHKIQLLLENKKSRAKQYCLHKLLRFLRKSGKSTIFFDFFIKSFFDRWRPFQEELNRFRYFVVILIKCITTNVSTRFWTHNSSSLATTRWCIETIKNLGEVAQDFPHNYTYFDDQTMPTY